MSKAAVLADLRIILKYIKHLPSDGSNSCKASTMAQFRANMTKSDKQEVKRLRWKAHDVAQLVTALRVRKDLLELHAGEKMTQEERIKLSAARVGFGVPETYEAGLGGSEDGFREALTTETSRGAGT